VTSSAPRSPRRVRPQPHVTFRTLVPDLATLSHAERALLSEWLDCAALASLTAVDTVNAGLLLPGHGEPFKGAPADAAPQARSAGAR
jgi:hypothetical protein